MTATTADSVPPATTDLPSGDPVPIPAGAAPPSKPGSSPPRVPIRALLAAAPASTDAFLAHLNRCLATPSGIDTVLLLVCYTSRFAASGLSALSKHALRRSAKEWIALVAALPPRTTILFAAPGGGSGSPAGPAAAAALVLAQRLKALGGLASEARMIMRLWGLLGMYFWGRGLVAKTLAARRARAQDAQAAAAPPEGTALETAVAYTQLISCVLFQALENGAYLSARGVLGWSPAAQARAFKWSSRFWAVFVGVELGRLLAARREGEAKAAGFWQDKWRKQVARNLAWAPLTLHWSTDKGLVGDSMVGLLGSIPGIIQMGDLWKETA